jgi:hypothetical protein
VLAITPKKRTGGEIISLATAIRKKKSKMDDDHHHQESTKPA